MSAQITDEQRAKRIAGLREIVELITTEQGGSWAGWRWRIASEMTMRIPADPERDADLVLSWAADELESLRAEVERLEQERDAWEAAMKTAWQMVDPLNPPTSGSYMRGEHDGISRALQTVRVVYEALRARGEG